jgi:hypothetical protein
MAAHAGGKRPLGRRVGKAATRVGGRGG